MILTFERRHSAGFFLRACMGGDAPDTSGQNAAAVMTAQLSKEQLDWAKSVYAETAPDRAAAATRAAAVSDAQLASLNQQTSIAAQANDDYQATYRPLEQKVAADAASYDSPERRAAAAASASAGVESQISAQRAASARAMERQGVDPSSGKALGLASAQNIAAAAAKAGASTAAERNVETVGAAKLADAVNLGRGIASAQGTSASLALNAGNSSVGNAQTALGATTSGTGLVQQGYAGAQQGLASSANIYGSIASQQTAANSSSNALMGSLGSAAGMAMMMSDEDQKHSRKKSSSKASLAGLLNLKVEKWKYRDDSPAADGGREHVGPMAQDVRRGLGDATAPGGRLIDMVSMHGHTIGAIQELAKGQERLAKQVKGLGSFHRSSSHKN